MFMLLWISQLMYSSTPMKVEVLLTKIKYVAGIGCFNLLSYTVTIKIYMEHMWQYTLREKRLNPLVLLVLWVKGFFFHLGLVGMRVFLTYFCDPFGWIMVLYLLLGPSVLIVCTFGMMTFILFYCYGPYDLSYPILSQPNLILFYDHLIVSTLS